MQRWAYVLLGLTVAHGAIYQLIEKQQRVLVALFVGFVAAVLTMQLRGRKRYLEGQPRPEAG